VHLDLISIPIKEPIRGNMESSFNFSIRRTDGSNVVRTWNLLEWSGALLSFFERTPTLVSDYSTCLSKMAFSLL